MIAFSIRAFPSQSSPVLTLAAPSTLQPLLSISKEEWEKARPRIEARPNWSGYDSCQISMHIANCGYGVINGKTFDAVDDEFLLNDVYGAILMALAMIENDKKKNS